MDTYLDAGIPEDLCRHLFVSFMKKPPKPTLGKEFMVKECAAMASHTVCAAITHQSQEFAFSNNDKHDSKHHGIAEKLHGLTEKLHSLGTLGHSRHDSSGGDLGRRSRAGKVGVYDENNSISNTKFHSRD